MYGTMSDNYFKLVSSSWRKKFYYAIENKQFRGI